MLASSYALAQFLSMTCAAARLESSVARSTSSCLLASSVGASSSRGAVRRLHRASWGAWVGGAEAALRSEHAHCGPSETLRGPMPCCRHRGQPPRFRLSATFERSVTFEPAAVRALLEAEGVLLDRLGQPYPVRSNAVRSASMAAPSMRERLQGGTAGGRAAAALLWSPEGRRARARGRLAPQVACSAAAGTTGFDQATAPALGQRFVALVLEA